MLNRVSIMGRLVRGPELKKTNSGKSVLQFTIAVARTYSKEQETDFIDVIAWNKTAEFITKYFHKGNLIIIDGRIQTRTYKDKAGANRKVCEVVAENVFFSGEKNISKVNNTTFIDNNVSTKEDKNANIIDDDLPFDI